MNNYLIKNNDNYITLNKIYTDIMKNLIVKENNEIIYFSLIDNLNYVKGPINFLFKYIFYSVYSKKHIIYKNKTDIFDNNINIQFLYDELNKISMNKIIKLLILYEKKLYIDITE